MSKFGGQPAPALPSPGLRELLGGLPGFGEPSAFAPPDGRRDKLWELSPNLHCSIIGTCLSTADLRSLLVKLGLPEARSASEHDLHGKAVARASRKDDGAKLLHKLLDRRHEREIRRFERADTLDELRSLWRAAFDRGEIPGAYWAVLTHPLTDRGLVQEAFGDVHMLSHLVGRAVRADLRRLTELQDEVTAQQDVIAEQGARIRELTEEKIRLASQLAETGHERPGPAARETGLRDDLASIVERLETRLAKAEAHAEAETRRRAEAQDALKALTAHLRAGAEREAALQQDLARFRSALPTEGTERPLTQGGSLAGTTILYVGGRPRQIAQARLTVANRGGRFLSHDGGIEEASTLLPGLITQSDAVLFPVDCVSHDAMGLIKKTCRDTDRPFIPLRTASLSALLGALREIAPAATG